MPLVPLVERSADDDHFYGAWVKGGGRAAPASARQGGALTKSKLSEEAKYAIRDYQNSSFEINSWLREGLDQKKPIEQIEYVHKRMSVFADNWNKSSDGIKRDIAGLDEAFGQTAPLSRSKTVWRGVSERLRNVLAENDGKVYVDKGYMSTTGNFDITKRLEQYGMAEGGVMKVILPPNTRVLPIDKLATNIGTNEMLLPRGSKFQVDIAQNTLRLLP